MARKLLSLTLAFLCGHLFLSPPQIAYARVPISISAPSAVLYDSSARSYVLSKTPHQKRAPASTTKLLTAMVVMDRMDLDQVVTVSSRVESVEPTKINLRGGERYRVRDLLYAILIKSANDAAEALAIAAAGSVPQFARLMNQKAREIGCKNSNFIKPNGLPAKNQYSTAHDLAKIAGHVQNYPFLVKALKIRETSIRSLSGRRIYLKNHNKMLWKDTREVIGKTGWTRRAKYCFAGYISVFNKKVIVSMLGSHSLWRDLTKLVDYQFGKSLSPIKINKKLWSRHETEKIQTALKSAGYDPGPIDGKFGPKTLNAVQGFQKAHSLQVDGIVGTMTWKKLKAYL